MTKDEFVKNFNAAKREYEKEKNQKYLQMRKEVDGYAHEKARRRKTYKNRGINAN